MPTGRITLKMIAAEVGLSTQAVSMALRDHRDIAPSTRERIKAKALELGYRPDPGLKALADYRTQKQATPSRWNQIAVVHNWVSESTRRESEFHREWLRHITATAQSRGIEISTHWLGTQCERAPSVFRTLLNRGTTGVLVAPPALTPEEPKITIPLGQFQVVTFGPEHLYREHHTVQFDYYENLRLCWRMLCERGHRRIGLVYHKRQSWRTGHAWQAAYHVEKKMAGFAPDEMPPLELSAENMKADRDAYLTWCRRERCDAIISSAYEIAGWNKLIKSPPALALFNIRDKGQQGIDLNFEQMAETAVELLYMEMQRSLVNRNGLPFRVHIPGKWVDA